MDKNNYVVYRHTSPSSKVYIGITCQKPEKRWYNGNGYKDNPKFYNAIQKYGWNNFKHEILFSGLNEISAKLIEKDLIYYYKKQNKSYNITDGGDGTKGITLSEETRKKMSDSKKGHIGYYKSKHHSEETRKMISDTRKDYINDNYNLILLSAEKLFKPVSQYSKDGKLIATYRSIKEASDYTKINRSHIGSVCKGDRKTAGGFIWKFNQ